MAGKPINAGAYNRPLVIDRESRTTTPSGGTKPNWTTVATIFGSFAPAGYTEYHLGEQVRERAAVSFKTRKPPTTPVYQVGDRITDVISGAMYTILSINDVSGAQRELLITCQDIHA